VLLLGRLSVVLDTVVDVDEPRSHPKKAGRLVSISYRGLDDLDSSKLDSEGLTGSPPAH
jgi:hypothetical protein